MTLLVGTEKARFQICIDVESANKPHNAISCAQHQNAEFSNAVLHWRGDFERVFKKYNATDALMHMWQYIYSQIYPLGLCRFSLYMAYTPINGLPLVDIPHLHGNN